MMADIKFIFLQNSLGHVSFTTDMWSRQNQESYMAVTAHFCAHSSDGKHLVIKSQLAAFRHVSGMHDGMNLAKVFVTILKDLGAVNKVGMVTLDNASNCNSMMREVGKILRDMGIPFDIDGNRIWYEQPLPSMLLFIFLCDYSCFPHVIDLCIKAGIRQLTELPVEITPISQEDSDNFIDDLEEETSSYSSILEDDVVAAAHHLVTAI